MVYQHTKGTHIEDNVLIRRQLHIIMDAELLRDSTLEVLGLQYIIIRSIVAIWGRNVAPACIPIHGT